MVTATAAEEEVRRRARAAGIDRDSLPEDPDDALDILGGPRTGPRKHPATRKTPLPGSTPSGPAGGKPKAPKKPRSGPRKRGRRRTRTPRALRGVTREMGRLVVWALLLVLLYQALTHAVALTRLLEAPTAALQWIADPLASIPYAPEARGE